jgi:hypothetical protein
MATAVIDPRRWARWLRHAYYHTLYVVARSPGGHATVKLTAAQRMVAWFLFGIKL